MYNKIEFRYLFIEIWTLYDIQKVDFIYRYFQLIS